MIGYLKGKILKSNPSKIIVDVNGVGYLVFISINTYEEINQKPEVELFIHTSVKEDSITLFGFSKETEKEMFELLIAVNGIGPKTALGILSGIRIQELKEAIINNNINRIVAAPGIGKKTAERLVLELRSKIDLIPTTGTGTDISYGTKSEAILALTTLGYNTKIAEKAVRDILDKLPNLSLEQLIKSALTALNN
ncbi:MAG: Holliday junction branch migration protein RuvA [Bacteroidota bacterium]|nr:Holliday junction branch migration protein RuvA [Bacteroidota bacterium]